MKPSPLSERIFSPWYILSTITYMACIPLRPEKGLTSFAIITILYVIAGGLSAYSAHQYHNK